MKLSKQIWNERNHNVWLWLELFVVSIILWFIIDMLYVSFSCLYEPQSQDISDVYVLEIQSIDPNCSEYLKPESENYISDGKAILSIINKLRQHPDIKYVCISYLSQPYSGFSSSSGYHIDDTIFHVFCRHRVTPDYMNVFQYKGIHNESPQELATLLQENKALISNFLFSDSLKDILCNKNISNEYESYNIGAILLPSKFESNYKEFIKDGAYFPLTEESILSEYLNNGQYSVNFRVKEGCDSDIVQYLFNESDSRYQEGNLIISSIRPITLIRDLYQKKDANSFRNNVGIAIFLWLNIFFGVFGTFWFRTQQRRPEIALHRAIGSSQTQIYFRIISEALIILLSASMCAWIFDYLIAFWHLTLPFYGETFSWERFILTIAISFNCMVIMVILGVIIPARKTDNIEISSVLREE